MPVCIHHDGIFVSDDVGEMGGFSRFLKEIYEGKDKEERDSYMDGVQNLGWSRKKYQVVFDFSFTERKDK